MHACMHTYTHAHFCRHIKTTTLCPAFSALQADLPPWLMFRRLGVQGFRLIGFRRHHCPTTRESPNPERKCRSLPPSFSSCRIAWAWTASGILGLGNIQDLGLEIWGLRMRLGTAGARNFWVECFVLPVHGSSLGCSEGLDSTLNPKPLFLLMCCLRGLITVQDRWALVYSSFVCSSCTSLGFRVQGFRVYGFGFRVGMSHINPLIMKPNKVGISLYNANAYVLFGSLSNYSKS